MPKIVEIKPSHTSAELRQLAASGKNANQSRRRNFRPAGRRKGLPLVLSGW
jgi:hypothetical protein